MDTCALARSLEFRPELTVMVGSAFSVPEDGGVVALSYEWEHLQPSAKLLDHNQILLRPR
jgi:hypothetical protein